MKINLNQFRLNRKFKGINIMIDDNKKLIVLFEGKYQQFLNRNKGTEINNKEDIIKILNRKPRSFLTTLNILVKTFKYYDNRLTNYLSKVHPKNLSLTKQTLASAAPLNRVSEGATQAGNVSEIINTKLNTLNTSLKNNKLQIPLNLLNPLLKTHSSPKFKFNLSHASSANAAAALSDTNLNKRALNSVQVSKTDFSHILGPN